jgi:pseudouridine-5'-monophosphatase
MSELGKELFKNLYSNEFQLIPGVDRLIKHLHQNNIPMAIATGNTKRHVQIIDKRLNNYFETYFSHWVCGWDDKEVVKNKPHPDCYTVCLNRFQTQPKDLKNVLIIEDTLMDIEGAVASGMQTILVKDSRIRDLKINNNQISYIIDSFHDFKPELFGLPAFIE